MKCVALLAYYYHTENSNYLFTPTPLRLCYAHALTFTSITLKVSPSKTNSV